MTEQRIRYEICRQRTSCELTLLHAGVQLGDLEGQAVDTVLEGVGAPVKGVGLVKKLPKNIFCMFTCSQSKEPKREEGKKELLINRKIRERSAQCFLMT